MATGQPTHYLLCGKIAAGKFTLARRLAEQPYTVLITEDHWSSNLFKEELLTIDDYTKYSKRNAVEPHLVALLKTAPPWCWSSRSTHAPSAAGCAASSTSQARRTSGTCSTCRTRPAGSACTSATPRAHPFQLTNADFETFTRYFAPPPPNPGVNVVVHAA